MRSLIDECLHESLVGVAHKAGFEATHVNHLGLSGQPDWVLAERIAEDEFTFVTNNRTDFMPALRQNGAAPGLIVLRLHQDLRKFTHERLLTEASRWFASGFCCGPGTNLGTIETRNHPSSGRQSGSQFDCLPEADRVPQRERGGPKGPLFRGEIRDFVDVAGRTPPAAHHRHALATSRCGYRRHRSLGLESRLEGFFGGSQHRQKRFGKTAVQPGARRRPGAPGWPGRTTWPV